MASRRALKTCPTCNEDCGIATKICKTCRFDFSIQKMEESTSNTGSDTEIVDNVPFMEESSSDIESVNEEEPCEDSSDEENYSQDSWDSEDSEEINEDTLSFGKRKIISLPPGLNFLIEKDLLKIGNGNLLMNASLKFGITQL